MSCAMRIAQYDILEMCTEGHFLEVVGLKDKSSISIMLKNVSFDKIQHEIEGVFQIANNVRFDKICNEWIT